MKKYVKIFRISIVALAITALILEILPFSLTLSFEVGSTPTVTETYSFFNPVVNTYGAYTALPASVATCVLLFISLAQIIKPYPALEKFVPLISIAAFILTLFILLTQEFNALALIIGISLFLCFLLAIVPFVIMTKAEN